MKLEALQKEKINAMKNKDELRKSVLTEMIDMVQKTSITPKGRIEITEQLVDETLIKYQKMVQEMIDTCPTDRTETLEEYNKKIKVINEFAPQMMSEDEVRKAVYDIIGVDMPYANKGAIMKAVMPKLKGKADGKVINKVVTEFCKVN